MLVSRARRGRFTPRHQPIVYKALRVGGALINEQLARYDLRDAYQVVVIAPPDALYAAIKKLDFFLNDLNTLGAFEPIAEHPGSEIVLGAIGRPWATDCGPVRLATSDFARFAEPGFAKIAWTWIVKPLGSGQSLLVVEWRTQLTDEEARVDFHRYWTVAARRVRLMARNALGRIKAECEGQSIATPASS